MLGLQSTDPAVLHRVVVVVSVLRRVLHSSESQSRWSNSTLGLRGHDPTVRDPVVVVVMSSPSPGTRRVPVRGVREITRSPLGRSRGRPPPSRRRRHRPPSSPGTRRVPVCRAGQFNPVSVGTSLASPPPSRRRRHVLLLSWHPSVVAGELGLSEVPVEHDPARPGPRRCRQGPPSSPGTRRSPSPYVLRSTPGPIGQESSVLHRVVVVVIVSVESTPVGVPVCGPFSHPRVSGGARFSRPPPSPSSSSSRLSDIVRVVVVGGVGRPSEVSVSTISPSRTPRCRHQGPPSSPAPSESQSVAFVEIHPRSSLGQESGRLTESSSSSSSASPGTRRSRSRWCYSRSQVWDSIAVSTESLSSVSSCCLAPVGVVVVGGVAVHRGLRWDVSSPSRTPLPSSGPPSSPGTRRSRGPSCVRGPPEIAVARVSRPPTSRRRRQCPRHSGTRRVVVVGGVGSIRGRPSSTSRGRPDPVVIVRVLPRPGTCRSPSPKG